MCLFECVCLSGEPHGPLLDRFSQFQRSSPKDSCLKLCEVLCSLFTKCKFERKPNVGKVGAGPGEVLERLLKVVETSASLNSRISAAHCVARATRHCTESLDCWYRGCGATADERLVTVLDADLGSHALDSALSACNIYQRHSYTPISDTETGSKEGVIYVSSR